MSRDEAIERLNKEDYDNLSVEKKIQRLESILQASLKMIGRDMMALNQNNSIIANALDVNLEGVAKCLEAAGVSMEKQKEIMDTVTEAHNRRFEEARQAELKAQMTPSDAPVPQEQIPDAPPDATVFGG